VGRRAFGSPPQTVTTHAAEDEGGPSSSAGLVELVVLGSIAEFTVLIGFHVVLFGTGDQTDSFIADLIISLGSA
jgi:hypothetical protein